MAVMLSHLRGWTSGNHLHIFARCVILRESDLINITLSPQPFRFRGAGHHHTRRLRLVCDGFVLAAGHITSCLRLSTSHPESRIQEEFFNKFVKRCKAPSPQPNSHHTTPSQKKIGLARRSFSPGWEANFNGTHVRPCFSTSF